MPVVSKETRWEFHGGLTTKSRQTVTISAPGVVRIVSVTFEKKSGGTQTRMPTLISSSVSTKNQTVTVTADFPKTGTGGSPNYPTTVGEWRVIVEYSTNTDPSVVVSTENDQTVYEQDLYRMYGTVQDADSGNTVTVKYSINNGTARILHTFVSDGSAVAFNKPLTFKLDKLHDGSTAVTGDLQEGVTHTLRVWAEDDQGGKSTVHSRTFNVIPNRPEVKVNGQSRVVETVYCKVNGQAREVVKIWTKVNGELREV